MTRKPIWISLALLVIGFAGGYTLKDPKISFILYHIGGFGALGLLACIAGLFSSKKGYGFWLALSITLSISILLGMIAAYLVTPTGDGDRPAACGGSVSLAVALVFIIVWAFMKRKANASLKPLDEI